MEQQTNYYSFTDELDEELTIDLKKIFFAIWSRKFLIAKVFIAIFALFVLMTFISPKKYTVDADLYINKTNGSNMTEVNPYFISEVGSGGGMAALMAGGGSLANELELMQSPLVIDKVIQENDIRVKKLYGIFKTKKYGQYVKADKFIKKLSVENKKGTNVVSISYKSKDKELAYGVVNSIINNYIALHQELNSEKSKADITVLETEYNKAKADLNSKMNSISGMPANAMAGLGGISAMSAFSKSAQRALSGIQGQYASGIRSELALREDAEKVAELAKKLEWARLVNNMSETSNVVVLKEPRKLQDYEQTSPKLFTNILLGIVFGVIAGLGAVIFKENTDKKLTYSMLGDDIIYNIKDDFVDLKSMLLAKQDKKILFAMFDNFPANIYTQLNEFSNISLVKGDISKEFVNIATANDEIIAVVKIGGTDSKLYKRVKTLLKDMNKDISKEILL